MRSSPQIQEKEDSHERWVLRSGARWYDLPRDRYPSYQTCHRRFQQWCRDGTLKRVLHALAKDLHERGGIDLSETFIDVHNFRRLVVRYDRHAENFLGFVHLGCICILFRRF